MNINLKKVIASVAALAMSLSCFTAFAADFSDVEATASYKPAIDELVALEIVNGYEDGTFKPDAEITRAEVTKMVVAAMGPSYTAAAESSKGNAEFSDVVNHWAAGFISVGVGAKFINGMGDGTFAPDANVTYAQIVKMLVAALGYESAANIAGGYPNGYISTGNQIGVTAGVTGVSADTNVTRAQVAQLISNALDIPLVIVTNWTTNILTGEPVAETEIQDGIGEDYKTLLTEYHNAYKVKGRVEATAAQGAVEAGKAIFNIEYADNYDDAYIDVKYADYDGDGDGVAIEVYTNGIAVEDLLFTYAEAIIKIDEDDEAHLVTVLPYGKNEIIEFPAKEYVADGSAAPDASASPVITGNETLGSITFEISETSSKTKAYKLDADAKLFVNGIEVMAGVDTPAHITYNLLNAYVAGNAIGKVTLIDAPAAGQTSKDGKFDYVMVTMKKWAIVDSTMVDDEILEIYLTDFEAPFDDTPIIIDTDDEQLVYSFTKDGEEVEFDAIKADDVLLLTYDVVTDATSANNSGFINIEICDTVVEGQVTSIKTVDGVTVYTIAGADYKLAVSATIEAGSTYTAKLDAAGRIVEIEETATSASFGVIDRVHKNTNTDEEEIRIIKADGTRQTYIAKDTDIFAEAKGIAYANYGTGELKDVENRTVKYKTNSKGEVNDVEAITMTPASASYTESSTRVGSARMGAATQILDITTIVAMDDVDMLGNNDTDAADKYDDDIAAANYASAYTAADIKAGSIDTFVDGEDYTVLYGDRANDGTYRFVIVLTGNPTINATTSFAVVKSVSTGLSADGSTVDVITAYTADGNDAVELTVDEDATLNFSGAATQVADLVNGDVIVYHLNADGAIEELYNIYSEEDATVLGSSPAKDPKDMSSNHAFFLANPIADWSTATSVADNDWARIGYGIVLKKGASTLTMAKTKTAGSDDEGVDTSKYDSVVVNAGDTIITGTETIELDIASDAVVYVYNYNNKAGDRVSKGAIGNVTATVVPAADTFVGTDGGDVYVMDNVSRIQYAFYKVLNDEITEIYVIRN
ncbi:MAG: S-layer homology domain-containing protein [Clostridia bacterium]|nr:S-layer homology domain-containing protein [Clostridia bacterium]